MKRYCSFIIFSVASALILPMLVFGFIGRRMKNTEKKENAIGDEKTISVFFHQENKVEKVNVEDYLCCVVAAEMPATFEAEALKAQAVAARSYIFYKKENKGVDHPEADVCTDYSHCKAYKTKDELKEMWKEKNKEYTEKIRNAVYSTKNEIITYNGEAALAVFHAQSANGRTENSRDVWGGDVPYLVSVESHGETDAPGFYSKVEVPFEEFKTKICEFRPDIRLTSFEDIGEVEKSEGGNVKNISIGKEKISGKDIRALFSLRSSCFELSLAGDNVVFEVAGYGHGVGMSQYGANTMAKEGFSYKEILTHYYTGTSIDVI